MFLKNLSEERCTFLELSSPLNSSSLNASIVICHFIISVLCLSDFAIENALVAKSSEACTSRWTIFIVLRPCWSSFLSTECAGLRVCKYLAARFSGFLFTGDKTESNILPIFKEKNSKVKVAAFFGNGGTVCFVAVMTDLFLQVADPSLCINLFCRQHYQTLAVSFVFAH